MVLAEAFMKRNDLKKEIAKLTESVTQNLWQDSSLPINFAKGTKVHPDQAYKQITSLMTDLQNLNVAIAVANSVNNGTLRELETTTARISLLEKIVAVADCYPGDKIRDREYVSGEMVAVVRENEWLVDPQVFQAELKTLQDKKRDLEKALAHSNFTVQVVI